MSSLYDNIFSFSSFTRFQVDVDFHDTNHFLPFSNGFHSENVDNMKNRISSNDFFQNKLRNLKLKLKRFDSLII